MNYEKMREYRNSHNPYAQKLGILIDEITPGCARVSKTVQKDDLNPIAFVHGGFFFSMADIACGAAMASRGYHAVTLNAEYHFFRSGTEGELITAEAREIKTGKSICVYEVSLTNRKQELLGTGCFTFCRISPPLVQTSENPKNSPA